MVPSPGLELHLDAFEVVGQSFGGAPGYLITSPEYQMKRLLAGGLEKIYSLGKVFRRGEAGPHHNPEFTMLEWYRANAGWQTIADDIETLVTECARAVCGHTRIGALELAGPWERISVRELMARHAGIALDGDESVEALRQKIAAAGHLIASPREQGYRWDDLFFQLFLDEIEPHLGQTKPTLVYDWPRPLAALARKKPGDERVVERFEVYAGGLELCNAFGELTCQGEQRARLESDRRERKVRGLPDYPIDERFLNALSEMAPAAGIALGIDRLAMLLLGQSEITSVLPFAWSEL